MNSKNLFLILFSTAALLFASCGGDNDEAFVATGISLDKETLEVPLESSAAIVATLEPSGAIGAIEWSTSDPTVVAVNNGIVTALKIGTANVVAVHGAYSASCEVTVTPKEINPDDLPASLKGSDYYLFHLDGTSSLYIEDKILEDMRPDDIEGSKNLYVWENTFLGGISNGLNYFGQSEGWISLIVGSAGWSGAGYNVGANYEGLIDMTNMFDNPDDYYFHIAFKSEQLSSSYLFIFSDGTSEAKVCIGSSAFEDAGTSYEPYADFTRDNEWHSIEIPVTHLNTLGLFYNEAFKDANVLAWLAGGTQGTTLDMDAMFFYKKAE